MACRVGFTTDLTERERYWRTQHAGLRNWRRLATFTTKSEAQAYENVFAQQAGCVAHPGGDGPERATWHVYCFDY